MKCRVIPLDIARGICILLVVLGHVYEGLRTAESIHSTWAGEWFIYAIYTFHVPTLFFLSGLNVEKGKGLSPFAEIRKASSEVIRPYLIWSYIQAALMMAVPNTHLQISWSDLILIPIVPHAQFWFLWALALYRIAAAFVPASGLFFLAVLALGASFAGDRTDVGWRSAYYLIFFAIGVLFDRATVSRIVMIPGNFVAAVAAPMLCAAVVFATGTLDGAERYSAPAIISALGGIATVFVVSARLTEVRSLAYAGRRSMALLVMHVMAGGAARILLLGSGFEIPAAIVAVLVLLAAIAGPLVVAEVLDRIRLSTALGVKDRSRQDVSADLR